MQKEYRLLLAAGLAGASGLMCELLWIRLLGSALGSEALAIWGTLLGFFLGVCLGSWAVGGAGKPIRAFAALQTGVALYAAFSPLFLPRLAHSILVWLASSSDVTGAVGMSSLSIAVSGVLLLPGAFCIGGALPALIECRRQYFPDNGPNDRGPGRIYAANTFGAVCGVLASVYWIIPSFGLIRGGIAVLIVSMSALPPIASIRTGLKPAPRQPCRRPRSAKAPVYATLALAGLLSIGLELVGVQILSQCLQNTVYTFANILVMYLLGTTLGAWIYQKKLYARVSSGSALLTACLFAAISFSVFATGLILKTVPRILSTFPPGSCTAQLFSELAVSGCVFVVPTTLMGILFSHLIAPLSGRELGLGCAANTLGCALAPFVFGACAIPVLGYREALYSVGYGYAALGTFFALRNRSHRARPWVLLIAAIAARLLAPSSMSLLDIPPDRRILGRRESIMGAILVTESKDSEFADRKLQVNQHFFMGGGYAYGEHRMGHLPLMLFPRARHALFLGVGTGATLGATRSYPLERVDAVEIVPDILDVLPFFRNINNNVSESDRVHFHACDARRYVTACLRKYDVVVGDLFHPARDGAGYLYSADHFRAVRSILASNGLFAQWIPLYQFDDKNLRLIIRTFAHEFPEVYAFLGIYNAKMSTLLLLGRNASQGVPPLALDFDWMRHALQTGANAAFQNVSDVLASYVSDREGLLAYAGNGPLNTDMMPRVMFDAPRGVYAAREDRAYACLASLLPHRQPWPDTLSSALSAADTNELAGARDYWLAVGLFLEGDLERVKQGGVSQVVVDRWLSAYAVCPDFAAATGALYSIARDKPEYAEHIYSTMLATTPNSSRVHAAYLHFLQKGTERDRYERVLREARRRWPDQFR